MLNGGDINVEIENDMEILEPLIIFNGDSYYLYGREDLMRRNLLCGDNFFIDGLKSNTWYFTFFFLF
jgi:hypothetical protein